MSKSAMPSSVAGDTSATLTGPSDPQHTALREAVIAGPGAAVEVDPALLAGALGMVTDPQHITAGLVVAGHRDQRKRVFTAPVVVAAILGLCLFRGESYDLVIGRVMADVPTLHRGYPAPDWWLRSTTLTASRARPGCRQHP